MRKVPIQVTDSGLAAMCLAVQDLRQSMRLLFLALVEHATNQPLSRAEWAATIILSRAIESLESTELLVGFGRERDAAILILSMFELQYDLQYICLDRARAEQWLFHVKERKKPWTVFFLLQELHQKPGDLEAARHNYRRLSMIKHANPASGSMGFPLAIEGKQIVGRLESPPDLLMAYLFAAATVGSTIVDSAVGCFSGLLQSTSGSVELVHAQRDKVRSIMDQRIIEIVEWWRAARPNNSMA